MTKIPLKPKKLPKYHRNPKNDQNTPETQKITKIPSKPKNDKNTPQTPKKTKILPKLKKYQIPLKPKK